MATASAPVQILAIGRLVAAKRWDVLIRAWTHVAERVAIAGDGELHKQLGALADSLGVSDRVRFLGHRDDVAELLEGASVLVSTSQSEGFAYSVLEALQAECVVVSTPTGVANQLVPEAFRFPVGDSEQCAGIVNRTLKDLSSARGAFAGAWRAAKELTVARMVRETERTYANALRAAGVEAGSVQRRR